MCQSIITFLKIFNIRLDDAPLIMQASTSGPAGSYSMATTGPIVAGKYYLFCLHG